LETSENPLSGSCAVSAEASVLDALLSMGLIYVHYGKTSWNVFVSRTINAVIEIEDPLADGVLITWSSGGPTDDELKELKPVSNVEVREYQFSATTYKLFIPCTRELSQDSSKILLTKLPEHAFRWTVVTVPYHTAERHVRGMMEPAKIAE
jgi:hypothetical protein